MPVDTSNLSRNVRKGTDRREMVFRRDVTFHRHAMSRDLTAPELLNEVFFS
ncbi:hypothetical protein NSPZN2_90019 [Nitrospira defluvii]|uniref:Uncharacterized protein n=1 Tax=Nitrospira defluvii TaxID=330214 RepID=A0ABN7MJ88_9BACT|nr:hypothetical protein NSPZN2_90019 [Nitrospira defluvii]